MLTDTILTKLKKKHYEIQSLSNMTFKIANNILKIE